MIRLVILVAIFFAAYPYIGAGFEAFSQDFDIGGITEVVSSVFDGLAEFISDLT